MKLVWNVETNDKCDGRGKALTDKTDYYVEGYRFGSLEDAQQAQMEQKKAAYFESRLEGKNAQNILAVYDKILDEKIFVTPVGWAYLKQLQEELHALGVEEEQIRPIPMYIIFKHDVDEEVRVKQRIVPTRKRDKSNDKFRISLLVNIILAILVLAMFGITLKSDNPNILNYRKAIINEYAAWEQELTEREEQIRQKEAELGIN